MFFIDKITEARIEDAFQRGELENLPGAGEPLHLDDDALVPPALRVYIPPEVDLRRQIQDLNALLRLDLLSAKLEQRGSQSTLFAERHYLPV